MRQGRRRVFTEPVYYLLRPWISRFHLFEAPRVRYCLGVVALLDEEARQHRERIERFLQYLDCGLRRPNLV